MPRVKAVVNWDDGRKVDARLVKKDRAVRGAIDAGALLVAGEAQRSILKGPKTGVIYTRDGISHQASSPGEAPASDKGTLASMIQPDHVVDSRGHKETNVTSRATYSSFLEKGTRDIEERPFMAVALEKMKPMIMRLIRKALKS